MDYTSEIENAKQKLFSLGFTEVQYNELLKLAEEEIMDRALGDLQEKDTDALENLEKNLIPEVKNMEEAANNIFLIFSTVYGEQAEEQRQKMLLEYLHDTIEQTEKTKDLLERYQAGEPTAVAAIEANKDNPEVEEIVKYMEENKQKSNEIVTNNGGETQNENPSNPASFPQPTE